MAKDERIFRVIKQGYYRQTVQYKSRTAISAMFARVSYAPDKRRPDILKVEAIDPADIEWTDVTDEFRNKPEPKCSLHPAYTGVRKPSVASMRPLEQEWYSQCKCWGIYWERHPDYPQHDPLCSMKNADPMTCSCRILKKLLE